MDILKYLPPFIASLDVFRALYGKNGVITRQLDRLKNDIESVKLVSVTDENTPEYALRRFAKMHGVYTTDDKNELVSLLNSIYRDDRPYNLKNIERLLKEILGDGNYTVSVYNRQKGFEMSDLVDNYDKLNPAQKLYYAVLLINLRASGETFIKKIAEIVIETKYKSVYNRIYTLLDRTLPVNVIFTLDAAEKLLTYGDAEAYKISELNDKRTYKEMRYRKEVLTSETD